MSDDTDQQYDWTDDPNLSHEEIIARFRELEQPRSIELELSLTHDQAREWYSIFGITPSERDRWKLRLANYMERKARKEELQYTRHRQREFGLKMRHEQRLKMLRDQISSEDSSST